MLLYHLFFAFIRYAIFHGFRAADFDATAAFSLSEFISSSRRLLLCRSARRLRLLAFSRFAMLMLFLSYFIDALLSLRHYFAEFSAICRRFRFLLMPLFSMLMFHADDDYFLYCLFSSFSLLPL